MQNSLDDILFLLCVTKFNQGLNELNQLFEKYNILVKYICNRKGEFYIICDISNPRNTNKEYYKSFKPFSEKLRLIFNKQELSK